MRVSIVAPARSRASLESLLRCLFALDCEFLATHPTFPLLYGCGVRYRREPRGVPGVWEGSEERWLTIPEAYEQGWGDCDDLAPWRAAELVVREGVPARPILVSVGPSSWHVVVDLGDGRREDPSAVLGMLDP